MELLSHSGLEKRKRRLFETSIAGCVKCLSEFIIGPSDPLYIRCDKRVLQGKLSRCLGVVMMRSLSEVGETEGACHGVPKVFGASGVSTSPHFRASHYVYALFMEQSVLSLLDCIPTKRLVRNSMYIKN